MALTASDVGRFCRHKGLKLHVCFCGEHGHVIDCCSDVFHGHTGQRIKTFNLARDQSYALAFGQELDRTCFADATTGTCDYNAFHTSSSVSAKGAAGARKSSTRKPPEGFAKRFRTIQRS